MTSSDGLESAEVSLPRRMKLGIMQPYFFPYLGYFSLIKYVDKWIIFDTVQYIRKGWINRNRIIDPKGGWQYIIIPIRTTSRDTLIKDAYISGNQNWRESLRGKLTVYKKRAPYYNDVMKLIDEVIVKDINKISKLNEVALEKVCNYLDINFSYEVFSQMNLEIENATDPGEWALNISKAMKAKVYTNLIGGKAIFGKQKFEKENIKLEFLNINIEPYNQGGKNFEHGLSIIDVLMFNSKERVNEFLDNYEITSL